MCYLGDDTHIVVATNSSQIKVFEVATWDCQILRGHSDTVLSLDTYNKGQLLVTSSKVNKLIHSCIGKGWWDEGRNWKDLAVWWFNLSNLFLIDCSIVCIAT